MEWIVTTARSVEEAQTRALDLLGVDLDDAEVQVIEEGKTGLFGRTKTEARVRARIKPKAPPAKEERRSGRGDNRNRNRGGGSNKGGRRGAGNQKNQRSNQKGQGGNQGQGNQKGRSSDRDTAKQGSAAAGADAGNRADLSGESSSGSAKNTNRGGNRNRGSRNRGSNSRSNDNGRRDNRNDEDRVEMPIAEQRETLEAFVAGVAQTFDSSASVELVEEDTTLLAKVNGEDLGRLIGQGAATLQTLEELARTAMHRAAAGRRYHRIQVDVDDYRARRREALARFATDLAESVAASGESKAMEPMGAADRKLVHDAVADVAGVETVSEGRDPRRYIVIVPLAGGDEEE